MPLGALDVDCRSKDDAWLIERGCVASDALKFDDDADCEVKPGRVAEGGGGICAAAADEDVTGGGRAAREGREAVLVVEWVGDGGRMRDTDSSLRLVEVLGRE